MNNTNIDKKYLADYIDFLKKQNCNKNIDTLNKISQNQNLTSFNKIKIFQIIFKNQDYIEDNECKNILDNLVNFNK